MIQMNLYLQNRKRLIDFENKLMVTKVERQREEINKQFGININILLYSIGNSTQYSVII